MLAMSYINESGINALSELVKSLFHGKPYSVTLKQLDYLPLPMNILHFTRRIGSLIRSST